MSDTTGAVRLTIVPDEFAAETIIALLRTEGIDSIQQMTDLAAGMADDPHWPWPTPRSSCAGKTSSGRTT